MGFFSNLFGGSSGVKAANDAAAAATGYATSGYKKANQALDTGYTNALTEVAPYRTAGNAGYQSYLDAIGQHGAEGNARAKQGFEGSWDWQGQQEAARLGARDLTRRYNAGVGANSGPAALAAARYGAENYGRGAQTYIDRLSGLGQTGLGLTQTAAGWNIDKGNRFADNEVGKASALAGIESNRIMQGYQAQQQGMNNLFNVLGGIGGFALKGFTPSASGVSPFGNIFSGK